MSSVWKVLTKNTKAVQMQSSFALYALIIVVGRKCLVSLSNRHGIMKTSLLKILISLS